MDTNTKDLKNMQHKTDKQGNMIHSPSAAGAAVRTIPAFACMTVIFLFSNQNADDSSETSGRIVRFIVRVISSAVKGISAPDREKLTDILQVVVRKCAHMSIYFILFLSVFYAARSWVKYFKFLRSEYIERISEQKGPVSETDYMSVPRASVRIYAVSYAVTILYSISDEIHQYFIPGRSCEARDVVIDGLGALAAAAVLFIADRIRKKRRNKNFKD